MNKISLVTLFLILFHVELSHSFVVLIDPGHGGEEYGAVSYIKLKGKKKKKIFEKDLALKLAKKVKKRLEKKYTVYLTRSHDRKVSLEDRAKMADTVKADLFISIHFNSSHARKSFGFETYYLDNHNDKAISKVENIENKNLSGGDVVVNEILIDLAISKTVTSSKKLANLIHLNVSHNVKTRFNVKDRGVKAGLFYVLALSKRPGVLIEGGFISNPNEVKKIKSNNYLNYYARGIAIGITRYQQSLPEKKLPLF
jgi:N-acetylmuramoyl-L-alanine amidase